MNKEEVIDLALNLGFNNEYDSIHSHSPTNSQFVRFRYKNAPNTSNYAVIYYYDTDDAKVYDIFSTAIIQYGRYMVKQELTNLLK